MNPLRSLIECLRTAFHGQEWEHWDLDDCGAERRESGLRFDQDSEDEVLRMYGAPTLIENCPGPCADAEGNIFCQGEEKSGSGGSRWLVYDQLLKRTRVMFHTINGKVEGAAHVPKLKRCPREVQRDVGSYYSPP